MKSKFYLLLLLFVNLNFAQSKQFMRVYTRVINTQESKSCPVQEVDVRIFYNYGNGSEIKAYFSDLEMDIFTPMYVTVKESEWSGTIYKCKNGSMIFLKLFDDEACGVMIIFDKKNYIQFLP